MLSAAAARSVVDLGVNDPEFERLMSWGELVGGDLHAI
jgi:hypothetical protein